MGLTKKDKLVGLGLGAGIAGALFLGLKYAVRTPTKERVPDTISPHMFQTKVLHTSLGPVVYHEYGKGHTLIFVHNIGVGASSYEWSKVYPLFAGTHRVMALDLIGFGESARPAGKFGYPEQVKAISEFIRATNDDPVTIIASGLGGGFCALLADEYPELVERLILIAPFGLKEADRHNLTFRTRTAARIPMLGRFLYRNQQSTRDAMRETLLHGGFVNPSALSDEVLHVYATCAQQFGAEHAFVNLEAGRFSFDLPTVLRRLKQPLALLWGEHTVFPSVASGRELVSTLPNAEFHELPNLGALAALEAPEGVGEAIKPILAPQIA